MFVLLMFGLPFTLTVLFASERKIKSTALAVGLLDATILAGLIGIYPLSFLFVYPFIAILMCSFGVLCGIGIKYLSNKLAPPREKPLEFLLLFAVGFAISCAPLWILSKA